MSFFEKVKSWFSPNKNKKEESLKSNYSTSLYKDTNKDLANNSFSNSDSCCCNNNTKSHKSKLDSCCNSTVNSCSENNSNSCCNDTKCCNDDSCCNSKK